MQQMPLGLNAKHGHLQYQMTYLGFHFVTIFILHLPPHRRVVCLFKSKYRSIKLKCTFYIGGQFITPQSLTFTLQTHFVKTK